MEIKNQFKIQLDDDSKSYVMCDVDMPLGKLYDAACSFKKFIFDKLKEAETAEQAQKAQNDAAVETSQEIA